MGSPLCDSITLPFLPGKSFVDLTKPNYRIVQAFDIVNGYRIPRVSQSREGSLGNFAHVSKINPALAYGQTKRDVRDKFQPTVCALDNKILRFYGYMKQTTGDSPDEIYQVRALRIHYYLEDDTIMVMEKHVENSGMEQGRLLRRQRIPKDDLGEFYHWKDLTVGIDVVFYGKVIRIVDCDKWTAEYLLSEGIELGEVEAIPPDPYTEKRISERPILSYVMTPSAEDKKFKFLKYDGQVLRFYCIWDNRQTVHGDVKPYVLLYYLGDDTIEVHEIHKPNDGCDPTSSLIHRQKIIKKFKQVPNDLPTAILELTDQDVEYFSPSDFAIGKTVSILGREFLLYDCDKFTKNFYFKNYGITDFTPVEIKMPEEVKTPKIIPPHLGWGTAEDSFQSCIKVAPVPPKKHFIWQLEHSGVVFRYLAQLISVNETEESRKFIISMHIGPGMVSIYELAMDGFMGGPFLSRRLVVKPDSNQNNPVYYTYKDFSVGAIVDIYGHKFDISGEDQFIAKYKQAHPESFSENARIHVKNPHAVEYKYETREEADKVT